MPRPLFLEPRVAMEELLRLNSTELELADAERQLKATLFRVNDPVLRDLPLPVITTFAEACKSLPRKTFKAALEEHETKVQERNSGISGEASAIEKIKFSHSRFLSKSSSMWAAPRVQQWAREAHGLPSQKARVDELRAERDERARVVAERHEFELKRALAGDSSVRVEVMKADDVTITSLLRQHRESLATFPAVGPGQADALMRDAVPLEDGSSTTAGTSMPPRAGSDPMELSDAHAVFSLLDQHANRLFQRGMSATSAAFAGDEAVRSATRPPRPPVESQLTSLVLAERPLPSHAASPQSYLRETAHMDRLGSEHVAGFYPSEKFLTPVGGFVYKTGPDGLGYYPDGMEMIKIIKAESSMTTPTCRRIFSLFPRVYEQWEEQLKAETAASVSAAEELLRQGAAVRADAARVLAAARRPDGAALTFQKWSRRRQAILYFRKHRKAAIVFQKIWRCMKARRPVQVSTPSPRPCCSAPLQALSLPTETAASCSRNSPGARFETYLLHCLLVCRPLSMRSGAPMWRITCRAPPSSFRPPAAGGRR